MEKTLCQKCFHYNACVAIDLSGFLGNPERENDPCEHFIDSERVKIQDRANWVERVHRYSDGDVSVTHHCSHCGDLGRVKMYKSKEWSDYYSEHYRNNIELDEYCKKCGSVMSILVEASDD